MGTERTADELVRLTLVFPPALEARLVDGILAADPALPGFTTLAGAGHAGDLARASPREQVRGKVDRRLLVLVLPRERVAALLTELAPGLPPGQVAWWLEPVLAFGHLP